MKTQDRLPIPRLPQVNTLPTAEAEGGLNVGQLLGALRRNLLLIGGLTIAMAGVGGVKAISDTPTYSGYVEILVQPRSSETDLIANIPETFTRQDSQTFQVLNNDLLKVLKSPKVLAPVIEEFRNRYPTACPTVDEALPQISDDASNDPCYGAIANRISVTAAVKESNITRASFSDPDPQRVQFILSIVANAYLEYSLESKQADIKQGIEFVTKKLPELREKVDTLQDQLQRLRIEHDLIDPGSKGGQLSSQVSSFSGQQLEVEVQLRQLRSLSNNLRSQLGQSQEQTASSALNQNPRYQSLLNELLSLDTQISEASTIYLDTAPDMQILKEQRQNLLGLLAQQGQQSQREVISQIQELEVRETALRQTLQDLNTDIDGLSGISRNYTDIQRELQIATENLNQFITKREALQIDAAQREIPWEIITPPTEPSAQATSLPQNLMLGATLGLLLGVGAALLLDKTGGVIYSDEEIKRITRLPILGRIPVTQYLNTTGNKADLTESLKAVGSHIRGQSNASTATLEDNGNGNRPPVLVDEKTSTKPYVNDPFSEAFRSLYTNIRLLSHENQLRSIAVSSVMASEGKSTVALYLAEAAAAMGKRVLLVDTDLRKPQLHTYLELPNTKGLTNMFSGESNPAVIQQIAQEPNMYIISAGSVPLEPTRLLSSSSMKKFTEQVKTKFDLIIYDTPPLLGQSDAYLVADHTDGLLLVTQPGKLKQPLLDRAMEQLRIADINVLGLVTRES